MSKFVARRPEEERQVKRILTIPQFTGRRKKVLVLRSVGGLGDILMHRMMFEDFHLLMPDIELDFACPKYYHGAVADHPFLNRVIDVLQLDRTPYMLVYNTSTVCGRTEMTYAPKPGPNRSDIWAEHCGLKLTKHDMHIRLEEHERQDGVDVLREKGGRPGKTVLIAPISAMENKNLSEPKIIDLVIGLRKMGFDPIVSHHRTLPVCQKHDIPQYDGSDLRQWMSVIAAADYVMSVDTATFHCAGGMGKPTLGMFTFASGESYSKYYPQVELLQGPCPLGRLGCYNWGNCPEPGRGAMLACCIAITPAKVLASFERLLERFPLDTAVCV